MNVPEVGDNTYDLVTCLMEQNELLKEQNRILIAPAEHLGENETLAFTLRQIPDGSGIPPNTKRYRM